VEAFARNQSIEFQRGAQLPLRFKEGRFEIALFRWSAIENRRSLNRADPGCRRAFFLVTRQARTFSSASWLQRNGAS
jgi:hypothetical protein